MANGRTCLTCNKQYKYCRTCGHDSDKPIWMSLYCCENCKDIFDITTEYSFGRSTKEETKELLEQCDLSEMHKFKGMLKIEIENILKSDKKEYAKKNAYVKNKTE